MNPQKVQRDKVFELEDLPNIGKAMATDLRCIGIRSPQQLAGKDPFQLYEALCKRTGMRHDPCVIDVFISIVHFMDGGEALAWWSFTQERKRKLLSLAKIAQ
jgi:hypothetical protein